MTEDWNVSLLDGFSVEQGGAPRTVSLASQRLVAYLALNGPGIRATVAGRLWPESSKEHALASLRTGLWRIRRALPGLLASGESVLALSPGVEVDARRQESLCRVLMGTRLAETAPLSEQLGCLWPSDLLPGWYDEWVVDERELLRQLRLHALERAAEVFIRERRLDLALTLALEAVRAEPLRESANVVLVSVHLAEGNIVEAVRRYDHFRAHLRREVGVEPSPRMVGLLPRVSMGVSAGDGYFAER